MDTMPNPSQAALPLRERSLVTLPKIEKIKLVEEARKKGLRLATYIRMLILTHPGRANGANSR